MRSLFFGLVALALASGSPASSGHAADDKRVWKVGILWHAANLEEEAVMFGPLSQGLRELGYVEGRNLVFEHTCTSTRNTNCSRRARRTCSTGRST